MDLVVVDLALGQRSTRLNGKTSPGIERPGGEQEANRVTAAKAKREVRKSQLRLHRNVNAQSPPTCQRTFRAPISLIGQLRTNCSTRTTPPDVPASTPASPPTSTINTDCTPESPLPSSSTASTSTAAAPVPTTTAHNRDAQTNTKLTPVNTSDVDSVHACTHRDRTSTSHIGLVGHLRIRRTETG
ncbi:hypothetical protein SprV_0602055900 [Sparganum proliferum]